MLKSYIKIFPASGKFSGWFIGKEVEVTEKLDGSQMCFGKDPEGNLFMRSKGAHIHYNEGYSNKLFLPAIQHILDVQGKIPNDIAFYCETLCKPKHNTLTYGRVPSGNISVYGITDFARTRNIGIHYVVLEDWAEILGVEVVPHIYTGVLESLEQLKDYMGKESALGNCKLEGVVVKNYKQDALIGGEYFPLAAMKYVSEEFKEQHKSNPEYKSGKSSVEELVLSYKTEARWKKAIQHLRDDGKLTMSPRDIGELLKELERDWEEEEKENVKEALYSIYRKDFVRGLKAGFPEYFKTWLLSNE